MRCFGDRILPSHRRAMNDIVACRTPRLGASVYRCADCGEYDCAYHSCRNRHCPKCHDLQTTRWLESLRSLLLPCPYHLITFTLPDPLRSLARRHQRTVYSILLREAAAAVLSLAEDPRWLGARPGIVAVLHTWTRDMRYHPHVHLIVTSGGISHDETAWIKPNTQGFLMPGYALSRIFRAKVGDALRRSELLKLTEPCVWSREWVVHIKKPAAAEHLTGYLSRYVFRVALTNARILDYQDRNVTFRYIDSRTHQRRTRTIRDQDFLARFLQHVLPKGFVKVRYYGIFSSTARPALECARQRLSRQSSENPIDIQIDAHCANNTVPPSPAPKRCCLHCGSDSLSLLGHIPRNRAPPRFSSTYKGTTR